MNALLRDAAVTLVRKLREHEISPVEVASAHLDRISAVNRSINAVVAVDAPSVLEQARACERLLMRGEDIGPLAGLPVTVKDTIDTTSLTTTAGTLSRRACRPDTDAAVVQRILSAGGIILAKTNTSELAMSYTTDNLIHGRTRNPWNLDFTVGGSSGGEAAIIAAGGSPLGFGSDLGGSIRIPAHFCGVAGLRPTPGRVPGTGHHPALAGPLGPMMQIGPLGRSVADLHLALRVIGGPDGCDPHVVPVAMEDPRTVTLTGKRVAFYEDDGVVPVTAETRAAIRSAAAALEDHGMLVEEARPEGLDQSEDIWSRLWEAYGGVRTMLASYLPAGGPLSRQLERQVSARPATMTSVELIDALDRLDDLRRRTMRFMRRFSIVLCPVASGSATLAAGKWTIDGQELQGSRGFAYTYFWSLAGCPALSAPWAWTSRHLPLGVQVVGCPFEEHVVLRAGEVLERASGGVRLTAE